MVEQDVRHDPHQSCILPGEGLAILMTCGTIPPAPD